MNDSATACQRLPSPLTEVLEHWKRLCLEESDITSASRERLQNDSRTFFAYISGNTQITTESQVVLHTKSSHEESLAQLIQHLGPAFTATSSESRLRALHVVIGALDGCKNVCLSNKVTSVLGGFLVSCCCPINGVVDDYDSLVRDAAIRSLSSLLSIAVGPTDLDSNGRIESMAERLKIALSGIYNRCTDNEGTTSLLETADFDLNLLVDGLSSLTRSRRSLCFKTLESTLAGLENVLQSIDFPLATPTLQLLVDFTGFTCRCLHGESDPRCLLQLLTTVHAIQLSFQCAFGQSNALLQFPTVEIFDAVVPYFPIQFTPPPNDTHGITRADLLKALVRILTFTSYDTQQVLNSMTALSLELFLDQLEFVDGNDGAIEKIEALECLSLLLVGTAKTTHHLTIAMTQRLATVIKSVHNTSSRLASRGSHVGGEMKRLADECRHFAATLGHHLEASGSQGLWEAYIFHDSRVSTGGIKNSPSNKKDLIAFYACLSSGAGVRTLRAALNLGLEPLLGYLEEDGSTPMDAVVALSGIGAFCSSCFAAASQAQNTGVSWFPHPLYQYCDRIAAVLLEPIEESSSIEAMCSATKSLECFCWVCEEGMISDGALQRLLSVLSLLVEWEVGTRGEKDIDGRWERSRSNFIGTLLGKALVTSEVSKPWIVEVEPIKCFLTVNVYGSLLTSRKDVAKNQFALQVLAVSSRSHKETAQKVTRNCLISFESTLVEGNQEYIESTAKSLRHILKAGGAFAIQSFHDLKGEFSSLCDSLDTMAASARRCQNEKRSMGIENATRIVQMTHDTVCPAYIDSVPAESVLFLIERIDTQIDLASTPNLVVESFYLPLIALSLVNLHPNADVQSRIRGKLAHKCAEMVPLLVKRSMRVPPSKNENDRNSSLLALVLHEVSVASDYSIADLITTGIPQKLKSDANEVSPFRLLRAISLCCLASSSSRNAACWVTAETLLTFLLAVAGGSRDRFSLVGDINFVLTPDGHLASLTQLSAASEYSAILADLGSCLYKQKLIFSGLSFLKLHRPATHITEWVLLRIAAAVMSTLDLASTTEEDIDLLFYHTIKGLHFDGQLQDCKGTQSWFRETVSLALVSILRLLEFKPSVVEGHFAGLVVCLSNCFSLSAQIHVKLLCLQILARLPEIEGLKSTLPACVAIVQTVCESVMHHPSGLLRLTSTHVRNKWLASS